MAVFLARPGFYALLLLGVGTQAAEVTQADEATPIGKVITLLKSLSEKVAAEGKQEAASYDKYACFCKEQADEKLYAIENSDKKIKQLSAEIAKLQSAIAELNSEIQALGKKITERENEIKEKTEKRDKEHEEYLAKAKDMDEAIEACGNAIKALKDSKKAMKGAKVDLAQIRKATGVLFNVVTNKPTLSASGVLALLSQLQEPAKFQYQSNDIIAVLEDLQARFKRMKKDLDEEEFDINSAFESDKLGLTNEKKFAEKEKAEKEAIVESKTEELNDAESDKTAEQKDKDADQAFMDEMTHDCEEKALLFDQRSKARADELKSLAEGIAILEKGAVPNYSANKKLVGVEIKATVKKNIIRAPSFTQISSINHKDSNKDKAVQKVISLLHAAAGRVGSTALTNAAMRVKTAEDHFVKVRGLIKDLISRLEADAEAEATQKSYCDKYMKEAVTERDEANAKIEHAESQITKVTANKAIIEGNIRTLEKEIASEKKSLLEATELRASEKAANEKTIAEAKEGVESVKMALDILEAYYSKADLVQTSKYVPPKSDREGNTVGDLAPEIFDKEYHGATGETKGIVGILEVILSDFERTLKKTEEEEKDNQEAFEEIEKDIQDTIAGKEKLVEIESGIVADLEASIIENQNNLKEAKELLEASKAKLADLENMCVAGAETWDERREKQKEEIEALKQALDILENWDK